MRDFRTLSLPEFISWLHSVVPPGTRMVLPGTRVRTCPIAQFAGQKALAFNWDYPEWVNRFMSLYDHGIGIRGFTTRDEALTVALRVQSEIANEAGKSERL